MVGEIRDQDTANMAIQAALTGHLVLSTLHTNDAPSSLTRLHDLGVQPFLTAATILGVLAQRLVRKLCPHCKQESFLDEQEWQHLAVDYPLPRPEFVLKQSVVKSVAIPVIKAESGFMSLCRLA